MAVRLKAEMLLGPLFNRLQRAHRSAVKEMSDAVNVGMLAVQSAAVKSIQTGPKSGRTYTHVFRMINVGGGLRPIPVGLRSEAGNMSAEHTASAPGEAPATDTGNLVRNIVPDVVVGVSRVEGRVVSRAPASLPLEYGTRFMEPRPFMGPAFRDTLPLIRRRLAQALRRIVRG